MAHQITIRENGYAEMAFVGDTPWHKLGNALEKDASIDQWRIAAGMDWTIEQAPVFYSPDNSVQLNLPNQFVQYRSDNNYPLSIVSDRYNPVQPAQVLEFFKDLVEENGFRLHTAGTLFGGKRMWALAETGKFAEVAEKDGVGGFLLLSTSADKSLATTARFTTVRVVCNNTLSIATRDNADTVSFTHHRAFDPTIIKNRLCKAVDSFDHFMEMSKYLARQRLTQWDAQSYVKRIVLAPEALNAPDFRPEEYRPFKKIMQLFNGEAKGHELVGDSRWGLLNAVTEYYDHHHPARTPDARLNNTWFGKGQSIKQKATELLLAA